MKLLLKAIALLFTRGPIALASKAADYYQNNRKIRVRLNKHFTPRSLTTRKTAKRQRETRFSRDVKISILLHNPAAPLTCPDAYTATAHNPATHSTTETIGSVLHQTYQNWELCIADSNIEPRMATGDFIAILENGDFLHPYALFEAAKAINEQDADFIYTDENMFTVNPSDARTPHYKPDYSPDNLRATNYIGRLIVFKAALLEKAGLNMDSLDGCLYHDTVLRLTEQAGNIVHIPKALYYARAREQAAITPCDAQKESEAGRNAVNEHLSRVGLKGQAEKYM